MILICVVQIFNLMKQNTLLRLQELFYVET